jgi:hypothetical protein
VSFKSSCLSLVLIDREQPLFRGSEHPFSQPVMLAQGVRKPPTACLLLLFDFFLSWPTSAKPERCVHHPVLNRDGAPDIRAGFAIGIVYLRGTDPVATRRRGPHAPVSLLLHPRRETSWRSARSFQQEVHISVPLKHTISHRDRIEQGFSHASCSQPSDDALKWLVNGQYKWDCLAICSCRFLPPTTNSRDVQVILLPLAAACTSSSKNLHRG